MLFLARSCVARTGNQGWLTVWPGPAGDTEDMAVVPSGPPLRPLELPRTPPSGCPLWEAVLCKVMLCFCNAGAPVPLKPLLFEALWLLPPPPPIGGSNMASSSSSASPAPGGVRCQSRWLASAAAAPGGSAAGAPPPLRRSCRMTGSPPLRSSPEGVCGWLDTRVTSGVWERPMLAVLLLALMPSFSCCTASRIILEEPRRPWPPCSAEGDPLARSFSASAKSLK
mmetsp:Transcript_33037/g.102513  ORF Transcript_33037/g.102513 Transcript_33037/m.102513 type:complete len:225 (-) Transcript_33037:938-1612(-)